MARQKKQGIDYFSLDCDFFSDRKIKILKSRYGADGITIFIYLLCEIYRNGYYIIVDDDFYYIVSDDLNMNSDKVKQVLIFLLERSMFDKQLFQSDAVLTSAGIQKRFQLAVKTRAKKNPIKVDRFWLLNEEETEPFIKVTHFEDNSENNTDNSKKNNDNSREESLKESKVKESKGDITRAHVPFDDFWILYPKKQAKAAAEKAYLKIKPDRELFEKMKKALEALGFDLPDPDKPLSRRNNRKITFDAACRKMLFEIAKRHGLDLEEEAEYGNRKYLEKQDFILAKQKAQLAAQQSKLDELTLKVNDMETLIDEVSAAAYDKAVEVVTDVVRTETRKEDMRMIEDSKKWVLSPERKAPQATREYAAHRLDTVLDKFLKTMQTTATRLQEKLLKPEVRQKGKEQVKEKARDSVLQLLNRLQAEQAQRKPSVPPTAEKSETRGDVY